MMQVMHILGNSTTSSLMVEMLNMYKSHRILWDCFDLFFLSDDNKIIIVYFLRPNSKVRLILSSERVLFWLRNIQLLEESGEIPHDV